MPPRREAHKILVVDDEEPILFAFREFFGAYGYAVDCARELEEALAMLSSIRYDLIIADLRLTGSHGAEGLEIIEEVRERAPWTRIILLTAYGSPEVEAEAQRRGADAFLQKPTPLPHIAKIVLDLLGSAESAP